MTRPPIGRDGAGSALAQTDKRRSPGLLMPGMDGFEVIRHVRQEATLRDLPILAIRGKSLTPEESALLGRETQALLQKNGSWQQQLIAEVGRVIGGRKLAKSAGQS